MSVPGINPAVIAVAASMNATKYRGSGGSGKEPEDEDKKKEDEKLLAFERKLRRVLIGVTLFAAACFLIAHLIK